MTRREKYLNTLCECTPKTPASLEDRTVASPAELTATQTLRRDQFKNTQDRRKRNDVIEHDDTPVSPLRVDKPVSDILVDPFAPFESVDSPVDMNERFKQAIAARGKK